MHWPRPQKVGGQKGLYTQMVKATHNKHDQSCIKKHDTQIVAEQYNKPADTWETKFPTAYEQIARLLLIKTPAWQRTIKWNWQFKSSAAFKQNM